MVGGLPKREVVFELWKQLGQCQNNFVKLGQLLKDLLNNLQPSVLGEKKGRVGGKISNERGEGWSDPEGGVGPPLHSPLRTKPTLR